MTRVRPLAFICASLIAISACDSTTATPTSPGQSDTSTAIVTVFSGTLAVGGTQTWAFSLPTAAQLRLTLGSLTDATGAPTGRSLRLTFGIPSGTGCGALQTTTTAAGLATHLSSFASAGTYCASVTDTGQLGVPSDFGVRITFGDPGTTAGAGIITYASTILPGGTTSRTLNASSAGTLTVVVDTLEPQSVQSLVLGIGFPRSDGGGCQVTLTANATRGSQAAIPVEAGTYCVKVTDPGTLTGPAQFSMRIFHP
jgi:hypothetical protein